MVSTSNTTAAPTAAPKKTTPQPAINPTELLSDLVTRSTHLVATMDMQRTWGLAHLAFLLLSSLYLFNSILIGSQWLGLSYKFGMLSLIMAYGIAVRRHLGVEAGVDMVTVERAFSYDGTPYFCLAVMWWVMARPVMVSILPLVVYSAFHAIAWAKDDPRVKQSAEWRAWGESLCIRIAANQANLLFMAAHLEIFALPYILMSWLVSSKSNGPTFSQLLFYTQFLRWQYSCSPKIRLACKQWDAAWSGLVQHPSCPKQVRAADRWCREQLKSFNQLTHLQPTGTAPHAMPRANSRGGFPGAGSKKFN